MTAPQVHDIQTRSPLDTAVQLAVVLVLKVEGFEIAQQGGHGALVMADRGVNARTQRALGCCDDPEYVCLEAVRVCLRPTYLWSQFDLLK